MAKKSEQIKNSIIANLETEIYITDNIIETYKEIINVQELMLKEQKTMINKNTIIFLALGVIIGNILTLIVQSL